MSEIKVEIRTLISLGAHARKLLASGAATREDQLTGLSGGKPTLRASVGWWADHTVRETAAAGPTFTPYKPFPDETFPSRTAKMQSRI